MAERLYFSAHGTSYTTTTTDDTTATSASPTAGPSNTACTTVHAGPGAAKRDPCDRSAEWRASPSSSADGAASASGYGASAGGPSPPSAATITGL